MRTLHPQRWVLEQNASQPANWRECRLPTPVPVDPQVLVVPDFHSAQALKYGTRPTEGPAWMEFGSKSSATTRDQAWSLLHSMSTCIRHWCLPPQALQALLPQHCWHYYRCHRCGDACFSPCAQHNQDVITSWWMKIKPMIASLPWQILCFTMCLLQNIDPISLCPLRYTGQIFLMSHIYVLFLHHVVLCSASCVWMKCLILFYTP